MTLYAFPEPPALVRDALLAAKPTHWPTASIGMKVPVSSITAPYIQHAWDGTPDEAGNYEVAAIRITAWAPKGQPSVANALADRVRQYLVANGIGGAWRVTRGAGRLPGIDDNLGLPFCTFTLNVETRPSPVA